MRIRQTTRWGLLLVGVMIVGCGGGDAPRASRDAAGRPAEDSPAPAARRTVLCLGTSLTAGPGLLPEETWPALLQRKVDSLGLPYTFVNAGVSGETSAGAVRRLDWLFSQGPIAVLVVETGANDMLRGQSTDSLKANLATILSRAGQLTPKPRLLLAAMEALPNFGAAYGRRFREAYADVAKAHDATLIPFLLQDVAGVDSLNQGDGIHPTRAGERIVAENIWKTLGPVLTELAGS